MSKRLSSGQSNTLFNYFQSPSSRPVLDLSISGTSKKSNPADGMVPLASQNHNTTTDREYVNVSSAPTMKGSEEDSSDSEDEAIGMKKKIASSSSKKRKRIAVVSSDSDSDITSVYAKKIANNEKNKDREAIALKCYSFEKSNNNSSKENNQMTAVASTSRAVQNFKSDGTYVGEATNWIHNTLSFLKPENLRDINKNKLGTLDYDEKTLYVPEEFLNKQTPAMRQWWVLKSEHFNCVLFFKVGKFYELYHMDAVVGVTKLGFSYMKGEFAHSGFPESAYGKMASSLIDQGYKVARVEQTETPEMMMERCKVSKNARRQDRVVSREICQISSRGTCVYGAQLPESKEASACYMIVIAEKVVQNDIRFGVCFIDTSVGLFNVGEFADDTHSSRLLSLMAQYPIGLIVIERNCMQNSTLELIKRIFPNVRVDKLTPKTQFYTAEYTLDFLARGPYFRDKSGSFRWPYLIQALTTNGYPKPNYELALKALGGCIWYLQDSALHIQLLSMMKFTKYDPSDQEDDTGTAGMKYMIMDSTTIQNLNLIGPSGTLQKALDHCETPFGKRLMYEYITRPNREHIRITQRQDAVKELYYNTELRQAARAILRTLPDLERQYSKIHAFGNKLLATDHPDSRAVMYESKTYSKRKILELVNTLNAYERAHKVPELFENCTTALLRNFTHHPPFGKFFDISEDLQFYKDAFDQEEASTEGKIIPHYGIEPEYDEAEQEIADLNQELNDYLHVQENFFGCKLTYFGTEKKRFQIEVPEFKTHKVTDEYQLEGTKKGTKPAKRYSTPNTRRLLAEMIKAETKRNKILQDLNRRIFETFGQRRCSWDLATFCLKNLDCLCALAEYAYGCSHTICFPTILPYEEKPFLKIDNGVHPCTQLTNFVPNSLDMGTGNNRNIMLLTGPNMGGKSTLMRQAALIVILAQMGGAVPASNCEMSLVDRIFTRLGAHDDIINGQSTFLVELLQAAAILQHANKHSLILIDELGRGTSTHDGTAIATAYVQKLTDINCRTIFTTHYHGLVDFFSGNINIQLGHMACLVDDDENETEDKVQTVTLLYQLREGICPRSYGFNAARLAGMPTSIIQRAHQIATLLENIATTRKYVSEILMTTEIADVRTLILDLCTSVSS